MFHIEADQSDAAGWDAPGSTADLVVNDTSRT